MSSLEGTDSQRGGGASKVIKSRISHKRARDDRRVVRRVDEGEEVSKERVKRVADEERTRGTRSSAGPTSEWKRDGGKGNLRCKCICSCVLERIWQPALLPLLSPSLLPAPHSPPPIRLLRLARSHGLRLTFRNFTTTARILFRCFGRLVSWVFCFSLRFAFVALCFCFQHARLLFGF